MLLSVQRVQAMARPFRSSLVPSCLRANMQLMVRNSSLPRQTVASMLTDSKDGSQAPQLREWLVVIPDNKGVLKHRIQIRPKHSENFRQLHKEGYVLWAGPVFSQPCMRKPDVEDRPFMGSVMVVRDVSPDNIYKRLSADMFITEGIWNWKQAKVLPFNTLMRRPPTKADQLAARAANESSS